jgi:hypothetical protein
MTTAMMASAGRERGGGYLRKIISLMNEEFF